ncbi:hypothetical protein [Amycolatopsis rifamycinica]|uniref:Uncharacterized protein n=1 Tax=Amycolatopsis rifamycinica TaxID=287986 RepID=A0A066UGI8_9PSEU|nr:hypothetical protein [Amycolatopsis rifamycinica]KDN23333.1 hypothetical protein DV20_06335 [Amycolatopsis rifamycinica]
MLRKAGREPEHRRRGGSGGGGSHSGTWGKRWFREYLHGDVGAVWVYLRPSRLVEKDLSYRVSGEP